MKGKRKKLAQSPHADPEGGAAVLAPPPSPATRSVALVTLLGLLLILALRLTMTESLRQTLAQKAAWLAAAAAGKTADLPPIDGPVVTAGLAAITLLLTALAAVCTAITGALSERRGLRFVLVFLVLALAFASAFSAANRFNALVGAMDLSMSLFAGWGVALLCRSRLLGDRGRRIVIMTLIAILAVWTFRGLYQRFVEFPETIADYRAHKTEQLQQVGIPPNDPFEVQLFENRMLDEMVSGFISFSNVMAAGMIGLLALLSGLVAARLVPSARAPDSDAHEPPGDSSEISLPALWTVLAAILLAAGILTTILTRSRGGAVLSIVVSVLIATGAFFWKKVLAHRKSLFAAAIAGVILFAAATISYGIATDSLPSKSLNFRWHYWTASARLIAQHPFAGVGLNNFGDYYAAVKRPSSPEDVTDPHSFFIRAAAELGIPATLLLALLLAVQIVGGFRRVQDFERPVSASPPGWPFFIRAAMLSLGWWMLHFFLADPPFLYNVYFIIIYTLLSAGAAWMAAGLLQLLSGRGVRIVTLAALTGAFAMLAYDQINMALVTGPVAMLFWVLLALADSYDPPTPRAAVPPKRNTHPVAWLPAVICTAAAIAIAASVWIPLLKDDMPWDPAPYERRYLQSAAHDPRAALAALDSAIARAPRSMELQQQRIAFKLKAHEPVAADIRHFLDLDHANARPRINVATPDSDLPPAERARILKEALRLDEQLPRDESKRLPPAQRAQVQSLIHHLQFPAASTTSNGH